MLAFLSTEVALYADSDVDGEVMPFVDGYFRPGLAVNEDNITKACTHEPPTAQKCGLLKTSDSIKCDAFWIADDTLNAVDSSFYWPAKFSEAKEVHTTCEKARQRLIGTWVLFGLIFVFRFGFDGFNEVFKFAGNNTTGKVCAFVFYILAYVGLLVPFGMYGFQSIKNHSGSIFGLNNNAEVTVGVAEHWDAMFQTMFYTAVVFMLVDGAVTFFGERKRYTVIPSFDPGSAMGLMNSMMMH